MKEKKKKTEERWIEGNIFLTAKAVGYVPAEGFDEDIEIEESSLNTALHGDRVKLLLRPSIPNKRQTGEVAEVLFRAKTNFVGKIEKKGGTTFLLPDDRRMYRDIFIAPQNSKDVEDGQKAFVKIKEWTDPKKSPSGEVLQILGNPGENNTEIQAIILEKGFDTSFPAGVEREAEKISRIIADEETAKRKDFRDVLTFTIDPFDAKDFDDAISIQTLENGDIEVGVHIADASYYVTPGSAIDKEAAYRGTSVYLVDRVLPMLPEVLSNDVCSLKPNEDKLTFSAVFTFAKNAKEAGVYPKIVRSWYGRTIIHSNRRFTYEEAQEVLDTGKGDYASEIRELDTIAENLSRERFAAGSISFEKDEIKILLDENGVAVKIIKKERTRSHKLIEDFMLLANKKVAEHIAEIGKKEERLFVYRVHNQPDTERLRELSIFLKTLGFSLKVDDGGNISPKNLNALLEETAGGQFQNIVHTTALRTMAKATYSTKNIGHFGLGFEHYTHFTSPIRRYPDILAHRLLEAHLKDGKIPEELWQEYETMLRYASEREVFAADAERASIKYKQVEYMLDKVGETFNGTITGVTEWGIYVEDKETLVEGMIRLRDLKDDFYTLDEKHYCLLGKNTKKKYTLGDSVSVKLLRADMNARTLDFIFT
ncbi:MAG: ribonuclease R [Parcubacteria group bacterium]|nr:ribonuclease R [Parcubacteria group bacterium]